MQKPSFLPRLVFTSVITALLAGCAHMPHLGPAPAIEPVQSYDTEKSFAAPQTNWPSSQWWTSYKDPQLNELIDEAMKNSPDMIQAQAVIHTAEGYAQQAGATLLPSLDANISAAEVKQSYNNGVPAAFVPQGLQDTGRATLDFKYEFDFWGRNRSALQAALTALEAAKVEMAQSRLVLSTAVANAYAELAQNYADDDAAKEALTIRKKSASLVKERFKNSLENQGRVNQAEAARATAEADVAAVNEKIGLTKNRIAALLGKGPDRGLTITRPKIDILHPFGLPTQAKVDLLGRRPDIVAARLLTEAAAKNIDQAKANFYPNINLAAYFGLESLGLNLLTKSGSTIAGFGPAINLPIFDGGRREGSYRASRGEYEQAVANYNTTLTKALQDVADAAVSEKSQAVRVQKAKEALNQSQKAYQVALNRYKGGLSNYLDVLTAEDALIINRRNYADIQARAFTLDIAMVRALGGGFQTK